MTPVRLLFCLPLALFLNGEAAAQPVPPPPRGAVLPPVVPAVIMVEPERKETKLSAQCQLKAVDIQVLPAQGGTHGIDIGLSRKRCAVAVTTKSTWVSVELDGGGLLRVVAQPNQQPLPRTARLVVATNRASRILELKQAGSRAPELGDEP